MLTHYKEYYAGIEGRTGVNCLWVMGLIKCGRYTELVHLIISTSACYTPTFHTHSSQIEKLARKAYSTSRATHIVVNRDRAFWSSKRANNGHNLTTNDVTEFFNYLINIYIQVGDIAYRQETIGIPMGTDCAPLIADLFLFSYQYEFMKEKIRTNLCVASKFSRTCWYIDDLLSLKNSGFKASVSEGPNNCDLNTKIADGKFTSELYEKETHFTLK